LQTLELDRLDCRILVHLQEHGRITNLELAQAVGLSAAQCHRRHRRLEEVGLITRYETRLNAERLGLGVVAFIHLTMERGHIRELAKFKDLIASSPQVLECYSVTGDFDYVIKVIASDLKALSVFLMDTLMRMPGVTGVRSSVCLDEVKCTGALPLTGVVRGVGA
jgi:Lrp/AsnC family leucine-responsive transcriptional regulator